MSSAIHTLPPPLSPTRLRALPDPVIPNRKGGLLDYLSASRLKCWQSCRRQFYFRYVEKIPTPTAPALYIGRQVHEILRSWNWARWKDEPFTTQQLQALFCQNWDEGQLDDDIRWKSDEDERKAKEQSWKLIEAYLEQCPVEIDEKPQGVEVEISCDLGVHGLPPLFGIIDLVRPGGVIVDYKTDQWSGPVQTAERISRYRTQLAAYGAALEATLDEPVVGGILVRCRADNKPEQIDISDWRAALVKVRSIVGDEAETTA